MKYFWLALYYGFAYYLPSTYSFGKIGLYSGYLRRFIFKHIAKNVVIMSILKDMPFSVKVLILNLVIIAI